ncbi:MAG: NAD-dependent epimerase/dehydratase family protein [Oscillospiraceae bacterium]
MKLSDDLILQDDLDKIITAKSIPWEILKNKTVLVTGATGLIGSQIVLSLLNANAEKNLNLTVLAVIRNIQKADKLFEYADKSVLKYIVQDIQKPLEVSDPVDYIIHGASVTSSKDFVDYPVETIMTAIGGTKNVLELAKAKNIKGMVYLSSLEVYGVVDFNIDSVNELTFGTIDPMSVRSSYSEGKRMVECLCASYAKEYNLPIMVARLCQTFGAGVNYSDNRVFAQFARSIIEGKDIVLKTDGSTERNYCYIRDAIIGILIVLLKGTSGEAYNIANKNTLITIRGMAELLIEKYPESGSKLVFDIAEDITKLGYNPKVKINLNSYKLEQLGWSAEVDLTEMFDRLISSMKSNKN